jgi:hypothetical protein
MAAKPRKSVVQNIIKNLLESEIPEIQNASKELADWIKQLEQHSFKLQHYATEIESWASEEEEGDTIELTDLIKDLEATLSDMRHTGTLPPPPALPAPSHPVAPVSPVSAISSVSPVPRVAAIEEPTVIVTGERTLRGYGRIGRVLRPRELPKAELRPDDGRVPVKRIEQATPKEEEIEGPARTSQGVLLAKDNDKTVVKAELPTGGKEIAVRREGKEPAEEEPGKSSYVTPEGFRVRRMR